MAGPVLRYGCVVLPTNYGKIVSGPWRAGHFLCCGEVIDIRREVLDLVDRVAELSQPVECCAACLSGCTASRAGGGTRSKVAQKISGGFGVAGNAVRKIVERVAGVR